MFLILGDKTKKYETRRYVSRIYYNMYNYNLSINQPENVFVN